MVLYRKKKKGKNDKEEKLSASFMMSTKNWLNKPRMHVAFSNIIKYAQIYDIHVHVYVP